MPGSEFAFQRKIILKCQSDWSMSVASFVWPIDRSSGAAEHIEICD